MKNTPKTLLVTGTLLAGVTLTSGQASATDKVYIKSLTFLGSGCTSTDSTSVLDDVDMDGLAEQFTILFSNYIAFSGPGSRPPDWRKNCNINVNLHLPQGYQFSIADVHYSGYAGLPYGVKGTQESVYQFVFFSNRVRLSSTISGRYYNSYDITDTLGLTSLVWSPCGLDAPLNIRTQVYLSGNMAYPAQITTDQIDGRVKQIYHFKWRRCTK